MGAGLKPSLFQNGFFELWHPDLFVVLAGIAVLYFLLIGRFRDRFPEAGPVSSSKKWFFLAGLFLYYLAWGSPWGLFGHYLFSAHMISQALAYLFVPPLIMLGLPKWFWKPIMHKPKLKKTVLFLTNWIVAVVLFNALFSLYHMPFIFNFIMSDPLYMAIGNYVLLITAFIMWWPIVTPLPELNELSSLKKLAYIFATGALLTPACALLAFSSHLYYEAYFDVPRLLTYISPVADQQGAGVFMKAMQEIAYGTAVFVVFLKWVRYERKPNDPYAASAMSKMMKPKQ